MRCPYCGGINSERATYCVHCGRDLKSQPSSQYPPNQQRQAQQAPATQRRRPPAMPQAAQTATQPEVPTVLPEPQPPEPPAQFPPHTVEQLQALEQGALAYTVLNSTTGDGRKKIVRIVYPKGASWQQVATLVRAFKEQQEDRFDTIMIQGVLEQDTQAYTFTNGQLVFERNVRLGSLITNRYQIETGNGFESDSMRIVLNE